MGIFKAYDIRGKYPVELNEAKSRAIGRAIVEFLKPKRIVVGRDARTSSESLSKALIQGLSLAGTEITDIGMVTTPMNYFANGFYGFDAGIIVTASHNPAEYNGFKICRENAIALSNETGLQKIGQLTTEPKQYSVQAKAESIAIYLDVKSDYKKFVLSFLKQPKPLKVVVDVANGAVGPIFDYVFKNTPLQIIPLYFEPDGRFPNHEPNPMKSENLTVICQTITSEKANLGVAFDGDGDRCVFIDEQGNPVPSDLITVLIAREILLHEPGASIVYDLRSSWVVRDEISEAGGQPIRMRVGHSFVKQAMRERNAAFGGELSGHYYFRENYFADSGLLAFAQVVNVVSKENRTFSEIIRPFKRYFTSGEMSFKVADKDAKIEEITRIFGDGKQDFLDGITVEHSDWWFNIRKSNTEPLLRLNFEAKTKEQFEQVRQRVIQVIKS